MELRVQGLERNIKQEIVLNPRQYALVEALIKLGEATASSLAEEVGKRKEDIMRDLMELQAKGLIRIEKVEKHVVRLTDEGRKVLSEGLPEERLIAIAEGTEELTLKDLREASGMSSKEFSAALGRLRRFEAIKIVKGLLKFHPSEKLQKYINELKHALKELASSEKLEGELGSVEKELRRRGLFEVSLEKLMIIKPTDLLRSAYSGGQLRKATLVTKLTPELIASGGWREVLIKEFDLSIEYPSRKVARPHPYVYFLNYVRELIISLGFQEVKGPHVELSLWNFDSLFVPQYHPSRRPTDVYYIKNSLNEDVDEELLAAVGNVHRKVLQYKWDPSKALRLVLRTHTTPVSLRTIRGKGAGEYRAFSLDRVFRPDTPDATHLMEFHQLEGIIVGRGVTFKHLLGFFKEFSKRLGLGEVRFRPAYFPFTEPSVEGYIKHPSLGWIEVFPGGMFRAEVLRPLGLPSEYKVAAWGIGIDRIAMMVLGKDDIRELYTNDLKIIESTPLPKGVLR